MLSVEDLAEIRRLHRAEGMPIKVVARVLGISKNTVKAELEFFSARRPADESANPVVRFVEGERPAPWGCLADGGEYLVLNGFLGEDELRRDIERQLAATGRAAGSSDLWTRYDRCRAAVSEARATGRSVRSSPEPIPGGPGRSTSAQST